MKIEFKPVDEFIGWQKAESFVKDLIRFHGIKSILEIGAGANPTILPEFIKTNKLDYVISDVDLNELNKADDIYRKIILDLSKPNQTVEKRFDLIFSRMTGEHISDGRKFHENIYNILNEGGISFHCFSTLYAFPFSANRLLPDFLSEIFLRKIAPRNKYQHAKFKAYYDWCCGPSKKMIKRYEQIGFEIIEYVGYFGHNYYQKLPFLNRLENAKSKLLLKLKLPYLTAYAYVLLKKPTVSNTVPGLS